MKCVGVLPRCTTPKSISPGLRTTFCRVVAVTVSIAVEMYCGPTVTKTVIDLGPSKRRESMLMFMISAVSLGCESTLGLACRVFGRDGDAAAGDAHIGDLQRDLVDIGDLEAVLELGPLGDGAEVLGGDAAEELVGPRLRRARLAGRRPYPSAKRQSTLRELAFASHLPFPNEQLGTQPVPSVILYYRRWILTGLPKRVKAEISWQFARYFVPMAGFAEIAGFAQESAGRNRTPGG